MQLHSNAHRAYNERIWCCQMQIHQIEHHQRPPPSCLSPNTKRVPQSAQRMVHTLHTKSPISRPSLRRSRGILTGNCVSYFRSRTAPWTRPLERPGGWTGRVLQCAPEYEPASTICMSSPHSCHSNINAKQAPPFASRWLRSAGCVVRPRKRGCFGRWSTRRDRRLFGEHQVRCCATGTCVQWIFNRRKQILCLAHRCCGPTLCPEREMEVEIVCLCNSARVDLHDAPSHFDAVTLAGEDSSSVRGKAGGGWSEVASMISVLSYFNKDFAQGERRLALKTQWELRAKINFA